MLLPVDGSPRDWIPGLGWQPDLIALLDDAANEVYEAILCEEEGTKAILSGLRSVIEKEALFCSLYTDPGQPTGAAIFSIRPRREKR